MTPLVLPRDVAARNAWLSIVWPASGSPPSSAEVRGGPAPMPLNGTWVALPEGFGPAAAWHQRVELVGLTPGSRYQFVLTEAGTPVAECRLATLPEALPTVSSPALTMLLASCFSGYRDPLGALGRAFLRLPVSHQPDLAVLTGDQIYLDTPIAHFLLRRHSAQQLAAEFASNYAATWGQRVPDGGFGGLAAGVATFLTGDDHELWNNAPNVAPHLPDTWTPAGRAAWVSLATQLFDAYQTPRRMHALEVPPLSVRIVDTRFSRSTDRSRFMDASTMTQLADWLAGLQGPAVLAVGQPVLAPSTGWRGHVTDWTIADYAQYEDLVRALLAVAHDVVVITGDVHFGRVAEARLPNGRRLIEIVASPMMLVDDRAGRSWKQPPPTFPARAIPGAISTPVTVSPFRTVENHFATLALWSEGAGVRLEHTAWQIGTDGSLPQHLAGFSGLLH
ncbi:hypothetical protein BH24CHL7_BH24CHL7_12090 [soil metagenome]